MDLYEFVSSVDIVEYISQFADLEKRGDEWWCLSPFTDEKTPSFSVRKDPPVFYDYSSGASGSLLHFICRYNNCNMRRAIEILKKYAGVDGDISDVKGVPEATAILRKYSKRERREKPSSGVILPDDYMERYERRIDKLKVWMDEGISPMSLDKYQVRYDSYTNRLVYPIRNLEGKIINVGGRTLDPDFKAKGYTKYGYFFPFGTISTIYGVYENAEAIKKAHEVILFEGCKSVLLADTWGIHNCGAILTSHVSANIMKILAKLSCDVVFALDKDVRVRDDKNVQKLKRYVNVYYLWDKGDLLGEKDAPVDKGEEVFRKLYNEKLKLH